MACETAARQEGFRTFDLVATLPGVPLYRACGFTPTGGTDDVELADGVTLACVAMDKAIDADVTREAAGGSMSGAGVRD